MIDSNSLSTLMPNVRIGIPGLPNLTNTMVSGGLYVLVAETASARFPLLASSLNCSLRDGRRCTAIVPGNPEQFIHRLESFDEIREQGALTSDAFQLFVMQEEFSKKMFRFGAEKFVQELEQFEIPNQSYLLVDQADDLISLHDISLALDQLDVLSKWLALHQVTALLVFLRITETQSGTLNALMDSLTGIVRLGGDVEGLKLNFEYWQSPEGTVAAKSFQLRSMDSNLYEARIKSASPESTPDGSAVEAGDAIDREEQHYFYMDPELGSLSSQIPGVWQQVDTLVGMMHATRKSNRCVVILCYQHNTNLRQLAEAAHTLRINLGRQAQLVVQEKGASLRYQNEALLLRLGINLVVHRDIQAGRIPLLLGSLSGQIFSRDVDINFDAALASVTPTRLRGYQTPTRFAREVEMLLDRSATLNIPYALIVGRANDGLAMINILNTIRLSRPGDLLTADNDHCYIFLNACQQSVVLSTLERLLDGQVDTAFQDVKFEVARSQITNDLSALLRNAECGMAIDYTANITLQQPAETSPLASTNTNDDDNTAKTMSTSPGVHRMSHHNAQHSTIQDALVTVTAPRSLQVSPEDSHYLAQQTLITTGSSTSESVRQVNDSFYSKATPVHSVFGKNSVPRATRRLHKSTVISEQSDAVESPDLT
jgi:cellulose biosynthesis protein BcsE